MTDAAVMTYESLVEDILKYLERDDTDTVNQVPRFIMLAENKIASEVKGLGLLRAVTTDMVLGSVGSVMEKPARWRETVSINIGTGATHMKRKYLRMRSIEYCRSYAPDPTALSEPKYYGEYDWEHWLFAPSPDYAYPAEMLYLERPTPLDSSNTTNWTTEVVPQLILYASLLQAEPFLKNDPRIPTWKSFYADAVGAVDREFKRQLIDRTTLVVKGG